MESSESHLNCQCLFLCREMEEDVSRLKSLAVGLLNDMGGGGTSLPEDFISEICRFGAAEIHCVASIVGGIASQECIKVTICSSLFMVIFLIIIFIFVSFQSRGDFDF
jgi:hypothetical protein